MFNIINETVGFQTHLSASMKNIDIACRYLENFLKESGLEALTFNMVLGAREVLNNSVIHGCGNNSEMTIEFSTRIQNGSITIEVMDDGPGFDFHAFTTECDLTETSGRGIQILNLYFDIVKYTAPGNRVQLKKNILEFKSRGEILMTEISRDGDRAVIKLSNDIVSTNIEDLRTEFKQVLADGVNQISLDLSNVTYVDSMGLGLLVATHNSLQKNGHKLQLSHVSDDIARLLTEMRLDSHFSIT